MVERYLEGRFTEHTDSGSHGTYGDPWEQIECRFDNHVGMGTILPELIAELTPSDLSDHPDRRFEYAFVHVTTLVEELIEVDDWSLAVRLESFAKFADADAYHRGREVH